MRSLRLSRGTVHVAWNVLHDSYLSRYCVTSSAPNVIACASLYIAIKIVGVEKAHYSSSGGTVTTDLLRSSWWSIFDTEDEILLVTVDAILLARSRINTISIDNDVVSSDDLRNETSSEPRNFFGSSKHKDKDSKSKDACIK